MLDGINQNTTQHPFESIIIDFSPGVKIVCWNRDLSSGRRPDCEQYW